MARMTHSNARTGKQPWQDPSIRYRGTVGDLLQSGGGKLSIVAADPGEERCEKPHEQDCLAASQ